jgi:hypothetical protein
MKNKINIERNNKMGSRAKDIEYEINENGCYVCTSHQTNYSGYPIISYNGKGHKAHRLLYTLFVGEIPEDKIIMHKCDNRLCLNVDHYQLGTIKDNNDDMSQKGRHSKKRTRLTLDQKRELYKNEEKLNSMQLCEKYGIGYSTLKDIRKEFKDGKYKLED